MDVINVPIAEDCYSTFFLDNKKLRFESYFFDWLLISPQTVLNLFENNFEDYFVKENLVEISKGGWHEFKRAEIYVMDTKNDIYYFHHFNNIDKDFPELKVKFDRKLDRLDKHLKQNKKINFYYKSTNYERWIKKSKKLWGEDIMNDTFPKLKNLILNRYSYSSENELNLIILK
jgi:predicted nucleic acid-binding protein